MDGASEALGTAAAPRAGTGAEGLTAACGIVEHGRHGMEVHCDRSVVHQADSGIRQDSWDRKLLQQTT